MAELSLNKENFEDEVIKSDIPVLVDFYAEWCGPCKIIGPILDELAAEYEGKIKIGKVDVDQAPELASEHSVLSIPTLIFFDAQGREVHRKMGFMDRDSMEQVLRKLGFLEG